MAVEKKIRQFILENLLFSDDDSALPNESSLLEMGLIDSTGVLELITFIEQEFDVQVTDNEMVPENLDSVSRMVSFVERKLQVA